MNMNNIKRTLYLNQLLKYKDTEVIKVITGLRRCGKSTLLMNFQDALKEMGVEKSQILYINFESLQYDHIKTYQDLYRYVMEYCQNQESISYLLFDEIQRVDGWEKAINSFRVDFSCDIYITGSNAYLLSSEISTLLSGRYIEIAMYPLSFQEYLTFKGESQDELRQMFYEYMKYGGMPGFFRMPQDEGSAASYMDGIYHTVVLKDVVERNQVRDVAILDDLMKFMMENIGNLITAKKISDYFTSNRKQAHHNTVLNYMKMFENAFILYRCDRYDVKGKKRLATHQKYYVSDLGIRNALLGFRNGDYGHMLENIIYFELLRRGYCVYVGVKDQLEVDFIAERINDKKYIQVCYGMNTEETLERELKPLRQLKDQYKKIILTMDQGFIKEIDGIKCVYAIDFLLDSYE